MSLPRVTDNDKDEITVALDGKELRAWSYLNEDQRCWKMILAREYVEGWYDSGLHRPLDSGLLSALEQIAESRVPDQPAAQDIDETVYIMRHVASLRRIAQKALKGYAP